MVFNKDHQIREDLIMTLTAEGTDCTTAINKE